MPLECGELLRQVGHDGIFETVAVDLYQGRRTGNGYSLQPRRQLQRRRQHQQLPCYYRCKLTCEQQARGAISQGYLTVNNNIVDSKGNYGFVRTDSKGKHLYLIGDVGLPKGEMGEGDWGHAQMAKESYVSINGINALYDVDAAATAAAAKTALLLIARRYISATSELLRRIIFWMSICRMLTLRLF